MNRNWKHYTSAGSQAERKDRASAAQPIGDRPRRSGKKRASACAVIEAAVAFDPFGVGVIAVHATAPLVVSTEIGLPARRIFATGAVAAPMTFRSVRLFDSDARIIPAETFICRAYR